MHGLTSLSYHRSSRRCTFLRKRSLGLLRNRPSKLKKRSRRSLAHPASPLRSGKPRPRRTAQLNALGLTRSGRSTNLTKRSQSRLIQRTTMMTERTRPLLASRQRCRSRPQKKNKKTQIRRASAERGCVINDGIFTAQNRPTSFYLQAQAKKQAARAAKRQAKAAASDD
ncbi:hypothetical protein BD414DRAFT_39667 [Trametes punicea]|nr:hypothetical protein BD414DRAFT_39667 [Trametes punicea]